MGMHCEEETLHIVCRAIKLDDKKSGYEKLNPETTECYQDSDTHI